MGPRGDGAGGVSRDCNGETGLSVRTRIEDNSLNVKGTSLKEKILLDRQNILSGVAKSNC